MYNNAGARGGRTLEPWSVFFPRTARCQFLHRDIVWKSGNNLQAKKMPKSFVHTYTGGAIFTLYFLWLLT